MACSHTKKIPMLGGASICGACGERFPASSPEMCAHPEGGRRRENGLGGAFAVLCGACGKVLEKRP